MELPADLNRRDGEQPIALLESYVALHENELRTLMAEAIQAAPG